MTNIGNGKSHNVDAFVDDSDFKGALRALQRGPIRFQRNNIIACEGDAADYMFLVVGGTVRTCKTFQNGTRSVVAFYLPGDLFGFWSDSECALSVEAAADAMVLFLKREALFSVASRESAVASFLLDIAGAELRRSQEHALLMSQTAKSRVAAFLGALSKKLGTANINFPMSRQDIADHLGLSIETSIGTIKASCPRRSHTDSTKQLYTCGLDRLKYQPGEENDAKDRPLLCHRGDCHPNLCRSLRCCPSTKQSSRESVWPRTYEAMQRSAGAGEQHARMSEKGPRKPFQTMRWIGAQCCA